MTQDRWQIGYRPLSRRRKILKFRQKSNLCPKSDDFNWPLGQYIKLLHSAFKKWTFHSHYNMLFAFHLRIHQNKTWATHNFFRIYFLISSSQSCDRFTLPAKTFYLPQEKWVTYTHRLISNFVDSISLFTSININFASLRFQKYINCTESLSSGQRELTCQSNVQQNNWKIRLFIPSQASSVR